MWIHLFISWFGFWSHRWKTESVLMWSVVYISLFMAVFVCLYMYISTCVFWRTLTHVWTVLLSAAIFRKETYFLTPSLPWCHLKMIHKMCEIWKPWAFSSSFSHWHVKGFSLKRTALKVHVIGPENILFGSVSLHLSAHTVYRRGQWRS